MPFYETYFMIHKRVANKELRSLVVDSVGKMTTDGGSVLKVNDFGWRHSGPEMRKPGMGKFHYGRWFQFFWAGKPTSVKQTHEVLRHNTAVTRFITFKTKKPSILSERDSFYLNPSAYRTNEETQHPRVDYSV
jgi:ribosomal protein S6